MLYVNTWNLYLDTDVWGMVYFCNAVSSTTCFHLHDAPLELVCICIGEVIMNIFIIIWHILVFTQQTELHYKDILI